MSFQSSRAAKSLFFATVFLGAGLLFLIQPLMGKIVLPWFGGSPNVWTVCLLFFQALLFVGYLYAHGLVSWCGSRGQWLIQSLLLAAALLAPVLPAPEWKPIGTEDPTADILLLLACHVGLPYLLLSATGPLLQVWYSKTFPGESPYWLYAISNLGSLLGLLAYPFVVDVWLAVPQQARLWHSGLVAYFLVCAFSGWLAQSTPHQIAPKSEETIEDQASVRLKLMWFALAMIPSILLSAITNTLSVDVSPIPFLWVVPLTLYLLSLIACFSFESFVNRWIWGAVSVNSLVASACVIGLSHGVNSIKSLPILFGVHLVSLFSLCMACHGELVRWKPSNDNTRPSRGAALTEYYLIMAAGGAAGSLFVAVIAPRLFPICVEHHLGLLAAALLLPLSWISDPRIQRFRFRKLWGVAATLAIVLPLTACLILDVVITLRNVRHVSRNFYGMLRVFERNKGTDSAYLELAHGGTKHGLQPLNPKLSKLPTTYYGLTSGIGMTMSGHHAGRPRQIGLVGLGVGTLATYGRKGDRYDFYEIDPAVRELALNEFRYLRESAATIEIIPGDARLSLERRDGPGYDIIVLDAFSSDAIPIHLLTAEAMDVYRSQLAPDGLLAVHVSNRHFNLRPILGGHAERLGWAAIAIADRTNDPELFTTSSVWVLMSPDSNNLAMPSFDRAEKVPLGNPIHWTDARHSLFEVLGHSHQ